MPRDADRNNKDGMMIVTREPIVAPVIARINSTKNYQLNHCTLDLIAN